MGGDIQASRELHPFAPLHSHQHIIQSLQGVSELTVLIDIRDPDSVIGYQVSGIKDAKDAALAFTNQEYSVAYSGRRDGPKSVCVMRLHGENPGWLLLK